MDDERLIGELQKILTACEERRLTVFVIGAFSVRAYDSLFRASQDLDLAVTAEEWPKLKQLLESLGYTVAPEQVWITAVKPVGDGQIEINIALDGVTDLDSATTYPLNLHRPERHQPADLDFPLPVLPLESVLITKLIALREKDVADLLGILIQRGEAIRPEEFWRYAGAADLDRQLRERLRQLIDHLDSGEAISIWYDRTGTILTDDDRTSMRTVIRRLLKSS